MKKSTIKLTEYIPSEQLNLEALRKDINAKREQSQHEAFAKLLKVKRVTFTRKLLGERRWRLNELLIVASCLGKNYQDYLKDSHADAAS
jgi:hypothetical protein